MTACPDPAPLHTSDHSGRRSFVSPALLRFLADASLLIGLAAALFGIAYVINGLTRVGAPVSVAVQIRDLDRLQIQQATRPGSETDLPLRLQQGLSAPGMHLYVDDLDHDNWLQAGTGTVILHASGSTVAEWLASRGGPAIVGLCLGIGSLLLRRLLLSIGRGHPFQRGNAARIAAIAVLIAIATLSADVLPYCAARLVLDRLGIGGPSSPLAARLTITIAPLILALFLLAFAEAFRRGAELTADVEGLV